MKKYLLILLVIVVTLTTTGCDPFNLKEKRAKENAVNYFKEKYNIDVKPIGVKQIGGCSPFCTYEKDYYEVVVQYGVKPYSINIPNNKKSNAGYDNYASELIKQDIEEFLKQHGVKVYAMDLSYEPFEDSLGGKSYKNKLGFDTKFEQQYFKNLFSRFEANIYCEYNEQDLYNTMREFIQNYDFMNEKNGSFPNTIKFQFLYFQNENEYNKATSKGANSYEGLRYTMAESIYENGRIIEPDIRTYVSNYNFTFSSLIPSFNESTITPTESFDIKEAEEYFKNKYTLTPLSSYYLFTHSSKFSGLYASGGVHHQELYLENNNNIKELSKDNKRIAVLIKYYNYYKILYPREEDEFKLDRKTSFPFVLVEVARPVKK